MVHAGAAIVTITSNKYPRIPRQIICMCCFLVVLLGVCYVIVCFCLCLMFVPRRINEPRVPECLLEALTNAQSPTTIHEPVFPRRGENFESPSTMCFFLLGSRECGDFARGADLWQRGKTTSTNPISLFRTRVHYSGPKRQDTKT